MNNLKETLSFIGFVILAPYIVAFLPILITLEILGIDEADEFSEKLIKLVVAVVMQIFIMGALI